MKNTEEEQTAAATKRAGVIEVASVHNTPPNEAEPGEVKTEDIEEVQEE